MSTRLDYNKRYNQEHKKEVSERKKNYYQKNKEKLDKYHKKYYWNNKEKILEHRREFYQENKERLSRDRRRYNRDHPEIILKTNKKQLEKTGKIFDMTSNEYMYAINSWSSTIKKLDNHMCKNCNSTKKLNAHHLKPKTDFPKLSLELDNGITLCKECHGLVHGFSIYEQNTYKGIYCSEI